MLSGIDDLIKNHLLPLIETDPLSDFARQATDEFRLAIKLSRSTPVCLSPGADKRQSMGELLTTWFPANDRTIYIMIRREEPDVTEQSGPLEGDDEAEKAGKGGKEGKGKGRGRGRPKKEIKPKAEPVEDVSFEDFSLAWMLRWTRWRPSGMLWMLTSASMGKSSTYPIPRCWIFPV